MPKEARESRSPDASAPTPSHAQDTVRKALKFWASLELTLDGMNHIPQELQQLGPAAFPPLIAALDDAPPPERVVAALLVRAWDEAIPGLFEDRAIPSKAEGILIAGVRGSDVRTCMLACNAMCIGSAPVGAVEDLRRLMKTSEVPRLRVAAAVALAGVKLDGTARPANQRKNGERESPVEIDVTGVLRLVESQFASSSDPGLMALCGQAMARLGLHSAAALKALKRVLAQSHPVCRFATLVALKNLGDKAEAVATDVEAIVGDESLDLELRAYAITVLAAIAPGRAGNGDTFLRAARAVEPAMVVASLQAYQTAGLAPIDALPSFSNYLKSKDETLRMAGALGAAACGDHAVAVLPALLSRLGKESDQALMVAVADALAACGVSAVGELTRIVASGDAIRGPSALLSLSKMDHRAVLPIAKAIGGTNEDRVRRSLALALAQIGERAAPALPSVAVELTATRDENYAHALVLVISSSRCVATECVAPLIQVIQHGGAGLAEQACEVLSQYGSSAVPYLKAALDTADGEARERLRRLLAHMVPEHVTAAVAAEPDLRPDAPRFARCRALNNEKWLRVFECICDVWDEQPGIPLKELALVLRKQQTRKQITRDIPVSQSQISVIITTIEEQLNVKLVQSSQGVRATGLTPEGRDFIEEVRGYRRATAKRRDS